MDDTTRNLVGLNWPKYGNNQLKQIILKQQKIVSYLTGQIWKLSIQPNALKQQKMFSY